MSGFICLNIDTAIKQILRHISNAVRYEDELKPLKELVTSMEATMRQIQHYCLLITWKEDTAVNVWVTNFNRWLNELDGFLQEASEVAQNCTHVSTHQGILRDQMIKRIADSTSKIAESLQKMQPSSSDKSNKLIDEAREKGIVADARHITPAWQTVTRSSGVRDILAPSTTSATISQAALEKLPTGRMKLMDEPFIVGQEKCLERLVNLVTKSPTTKKIGVLGQGGSGLVDEARDKGMSGLVDEARDKGIVADARHITPAWQTVTPSFGVRDILAPSTTSATISQAALDKSPTGTGRMKLMEEPSIVGQEKCPETLQNLVTNESPTLQNLVTNESPTTKKIGVLGQGGSGKTLLLKRLFNSKKVRDYFENGFLLWLNVSKSPSFISLRNKLWTQIKIQDKKGAVKNINEQHVEIWIAIQNNVDALQNTVGEQEVKDGVNETLQNSSGFLLFLDDVWDMSAEKLLDELGILKSVTNNTNSKVIVSSRDTAALSKMEIEDADIEKIKSLNEHDSWKLFSSHAFPNDNRIPPGKEEAKLVCQMCQGLPLAIKVVGKAMAGSTDRKQWRWALQRLSNIKSVYDCRLRFSFEALGNEGVKMQCCFLLVAATSLEDEVLFARHVIVLWAGEGLLSGKTVHEEGYDPFEMGWNYLSLLADRYLIEPMMRDHDGRVVCFRIHDELRTLAIQIAEKQENFYFSAGKKSPVLNGAEYSGCTRIFWSYKESIDQSPKASSGSEDSVQVCSLSISESEDSVLEKIPGKMLGSMSYLKFMDLSWTGVKSLPDTLGKLKQLVCLSLMGVPIKILPESLTTLVNLEILDLSFSSITELPSGLHMLTSLRYLGLSHCKDLQYLPRSISALTSLQYLHMAECNSLWTNAGRHKWKKVASISDLGKLTKVKWLELQNNGETFDEMMAEVETLRLTLTKTKSLPSSIGEMSKLKRLALKCPDLNKMELSRNKNDYFQNLNCLILFNCNMLVRLPDFHKLRNLQRLEIIACRKVKKFEAEAFDAGAFSSLKIFSLVRLEKLEKLPEINEGAMPSLKIFTIMECPALQKLPEGYLELKTEKLPEGYLELKTAEKIRIYSCPKVVEQVEKWKVEQVEKWKEEEEVEKWKEEVKSNMNKMVKTMSIRDTEEIKKWHFQLCVKHGNWVYGELWCSELFLFLGGLDTLV